MALLFASHASTLHAQNSNNILGLPAVPQTPQVAASGAPAAKPGVPILPTESEIKSAISGSIKLASFYQSGLVTVRVVTVKTFVGSAPRAQALQAARLIQRDVRLSCGKLCKPAPMPAPTLLPDNTLSFDLIVSGYVGTLSAADMVNFVSAKAIGPGSKREPGTVDKTPAVAAAAPAASAAPASVAPSGAASAAVPP